MPRTRVREGWRLSIFLTAVVSLWVGWFVASVLFDANDGRGFVAAFAVAGMCVAVLTVWLNPRPRPARREHGGITPANR
jgi:hypothetical protein